MKQVRPEYLVVATIGLVGIVSFLISRVSGWSALANFYRSSGEFLGQVWRFQSGQFRWHMGYNNCLTIGANASGLYLSTFFILRIGHPSLFIPWSDVSATLQKSFWGRYLEFRFSQAPNIPLRISLPLGEKVLKASGHSGLQMDFGGREKR